MARIPSLLVSSSRGLQYPGGGVQRCNREYISILHSAGFELQLLPYEFQTSLYDRIRRKIFFGTPDISAPKGLQESIIDYLSCNRVDFVFFALNVYPEISRSIKAEHPRVVQVLLSHGVESLDMQVEQRLRRHWNSENTSRLKADWRLGHQLMCESMQREWIDGVLTLSPLDVEVEQWLGTKRCINVPKSIDVVGIEYSPINGRVGSVSTLNHPPNYDGYIRLFEALDSIVSSDFRFRLVGQPESIGRALRERYTFVEYLGALSEKDLLEEVSTWCCFVHPLFVYPKGYSTKLGVGLGWGLPIATTEYGARGYCIDARYLPLARTPEELAMLTLERSSQGCFPKHQKDVTSAISAAPSRIEVAEGIKVFLDSLIPDIAP